MRIGIDARSLRCPRTGIGNYIHGIVQMLPQIAPEHEYFLYSNREIELAGVNGDVNRRVDHALTLCPGSVWLMGRGGALARRDHVDVFWATTAILPAGIPRNVLKIVTVYDVVWLLFPETMKTKNLVGCRMFARRAISGADKVVVISRSTGEDLVRFLGIPDERIKLVYPGIHGRYTPQEPEKAAAYISSKYRVPRRYMAAVGTIEPRKNLNLLVKVLEILKSRDKLDCTLLIAGASGWKNSHLYAEIRAAGLTDAEIQFLGYLPDEDLPFFYSGAQVFLFPSMYEGFGIPPVEAMACGVPVVASNATCMPEVLGDAAILVPPTSAEGMADAILRVLGDENLRGSMRAAGIERAQKFGAGRCAREMLRVLSETVADHG